MGPFLSRGISHFFRLFVVVSGARSGVPIEARSWPSILGSARRRWPEPCQGRSRRRRGPKARLYEGPAIAENRSPMSVGRLSPSLAVQHACLSSTSAGEVGFPAVPDPIRGVPLSSQTRGLQARIRGSRKRSLPRGPIREARWRGTEGTGPILTAASLSHSPVRRPAHLGRLSGSARFSLAHPIRRTLDDARPSPPPRSCVAAHAAARRAPSGMTPSWT
jgi:hypothetical protein